MADETDEGKGDVKASRCPHIEMQPRRRLVISDGKVKSKMLERKAAAAAVLYKSKILKSVCLFIPV